MQLLRLKLPLDGHAFCISSRYLRGLRDQVTAIRWLPMKSMSIDRYIVFRTQLRFLMDSVRGLANPRRWLGIEKHRGVPSQR